MTFFHRMIATAIVAIQLGVMRIVVSAQQNNDQDENRDWCRDPRFDHLNATASYSVSGFAPPGDTSSFSDSTWTFSIGAVNYDGKITQRLWINTSPAIQVDSDSLSYQGCILAFLRLNTEIPAEGEQNKDGDCTSALGEKCVAAILKNANDIGRNLSTNANEDSKRYNRRPVQNIAFPLAQCAEFAFNGYPPECSKIRSSGPNIWEAASIGHHPKLYINTTLALESGFDEPSKCPNIGTNGTAATSPILEFYTAPVPDDTGLFNPNYSTYDQWLNRVLPVLIPVWSKDSKQIWSDSRLICMRPEAVKQEEKSGSRSGSGGTTSTQQSGSSAQTSSAAQPSESVKIGFGVRAVGGLSQGTAIGSIFIVVLLMMMTI